MPSVPFATMGDAREIREAATARVMSEPASAPPIVCETRYLHSSSLVVSQALAQNIGETGSRQYPTKPCEWLHDVRPGLRPWLRVSDGEPNHATRGTYPDDWYACVGYGVPSTVVGMAMSPLLARYANAHR